MNNLRRLAGAECKNGHCDTVYASDSGEMVVLGQAVAEGLSFGDGEQAVKIPIRLIREALAALEGC
jgi:hypothetical protein